MQPRILQRMVAIALAVSLASTSFADIARDTWCVLRTTAVSLHGERPTCHVLVSSLSFGAQALALWSEGQLRSQSHANVSRQIRQAEQYQDEFRKIIEQPEHFQHEIYEVLRRRASQLMRGIPGADADDIVHRVWIKAVGSLRRNEFKGENRPLAYLFRMVYHEALMERRHQHSLNRIGAEYHSVHVVESIEGAESAAIRQDSLKKVLHVVQSLPESFRIALIAQMNGNGSNKQHAHSLGITEEAYKIRLHRARNELKKRLEGMGLGLKISRLFSIVIAAMTVAGTALLFDSPADAMERFRFSGGASTSHIAMAFLSWRTMANAVEWAVCLVALWPLARLLSAHLFARSANDELIREGRRPYFAELIKLIENGLKEKKDQERFKELVRLWRMFQLADQKNRGLPWPLKIQLPQAILKSLQSIMDADFLLASQCDKVLDRLFESYPPEHRRVVENVIYIYERLLGGQRPDDIYIREIVMNARPSQIREIARLLGTAEQFTPLANQLRVDILSQIAFRYRNDHKAMKEINGLHGLLATEIKYRVARRLRWANPGMRPFDIRCAEAS